MPESRLRGRDADLGPPLLPPTQLTLREVRSWTKSECWLQQRWSTAHPASAGASPRPYPLALAPPAFRVNGGWWSHVTEGGQDPEWPCRAELFPQPITHLTWARNALECVKLLAFQADCSAVSLLCYRVAPLLTWSIYSALFSDPPALLSLKNYFLFSPGNCPVKYVIHVSSPYSAAWGAGKTHTRCQPRKSPTRGGRRHTGTQEERLKVKVRVVPIFHLQFQRAALWFHQVNTTEVLFCPRACLHVGNALTFVLGLTADKVHF